MASKFESCTNRTSEVGLVGEESKFQTLLKHGLIPDDAYGNVFTGKFTPQGGSDVTKYAGCIRAFAKKELSPYFTAFAPEIVSVTKAHPFGVLAARQATNAVLITSACRKGRSC